MAVQNFVEGGFYGKLGAMVGQRWRNIRIVKAYTIPNNPRTPAQQANRGLFREAVENAQVAMMLNQGSPIFNSEDNTSWGNRMASARACQASGKSGFNLLPVLPKDFTPPFVANRIKLVSTVAGTSATFELEGNLPSTDREISIIYATKASVAEEYQTTIATATLSVGATVSFTIADSHPELFNSFSKFLIVTNDDTETTKLTLYMPETFLSTHDPITRSFNTAISSVLRSDNTFRVVLAEPFIDASTTLNAVQIRAVSNGAWTAQSIASASLVNENGYFAIEFTQAESVGARIWAFPSGSTVTIGSISAINADYILTAENVTENAISSDLTRDLWAEIDSKGFADDLYKIVLKQGYVDGVDTFSQSGLVVENQSYFDGSAWSGFVYQDTVSGKLALCCENEDDPAQWIAIQGSAVKATRITVTAQGVTYTATNINLPYTENQGECRLIGVAHVFGNQSISQRMTIGVALASQFDAIYSALTPAEVIARLTIPGDSNSYTYYNSNPDFNVSGTGITIIGYQNHELLISLPACNSSNFVGQSIDFEYELSWIDNVLGVRTYAYSDEVMTGNLWTA